MKINKNERNKRKQHRAHFSTTRMIAAGFLIAIALGTFLLSLPIATRDRSVTPFTDALFTATTSTCVTGLTTVVTAEHWSLFGQVVILFLIQFGGLGIVTFTTSIFLLLGRRISLQDRLLIQEAYNLDKLQGLVGITLRILKGTLVVEGIGALCYAFEFVPKYRLFKGIWFSIFHSVSAFCNAGIDLLGDSSLVNYCGNTWMNVVTMTLIVLGGLGFPVWWDIVQNVREMIQKKKRKERVLFQLTLQSKLVLSVTAFLIIAGMIFILAMEYNNPATLKNLPFGKKVLASLFQSVTLRTAGFATIAQENFTNGSSLFFLVLMFIGGSPSGTAGGVKTVTMVLIFASVFTTVRGNSETNLFHRRITEAYIKKALSVVFVSFFGVLALTTLLLTVQGGDFLDALYEMTSAMATVGLSRNFTGSLVGAGKLIVILGMYLGRIGPITMMLAVNPKNNNKNYSYPSGRILVG